MQGIKARYAARQASSEKAMEYGGAMEGQGELAWTFVQEVERKGREEGVEGKGEARAAGRGYMVKL